MFKKIISSLLCAAITLNLFSVSISAEGAYEEPVHENEGIIEALRLIEPVKENYGLTDEDLVKIEAAAPIKTYEYTSDGLCFLSNYVPLTCDDALVAWAIEAVDDNKVFYQISTAYIDEINAAIDNTTSFALIYDQNSCYIVDGAEMKKLGSYEEVGGRSVLTKDVLENYEVELNSVCETYELGYTHGNATYGIVLPEGQYTYKCDVLHITQIGYSNPNLCWAASIACIVNYVKGTFYTALHIFNENESLADKDGKLPYKSEVEILKKYGLSYQCKGYVPSISVIENNIRNDYPFYGYFTYNVNGTVYAHACAIYGCTTDNTNSENNCIYVMDPESGFTTARYSSQSYKYISSYSGVTLTLKSTTCRY